MTDNLEMVLNAHLVYKFYVVQYVHRTFIYVSIN